MGGGGSCVSAATFFCATTELSEERLPMRVDVRLNSVDFVSDGCVDRGAK